MFYVDMGELIVDDLFYGVFWYVVVFDIEIGEEKVCVDMGCLVFSGMWYILGFGWDFYIFIFLGGVVWFYVEWWVCLRKLIFLFLGDIFFGFGLKFILM